MRRIDASERPMPEINPAKVCFVIEKSRELSERGRRHRARRLQPDRRRRAHHPDRRRQLDPPRAGRIHPGPRRRRSGRAGRARLDRARGLRGRRLGERGRGGLRAARGADLEISPRHGPPARLSAGRALGLRAVVRGLRAGGRAVALCVWAEPAAALAPSLGSAPSCLCGEIEPMAVADGVARTTERAAFRGRISFFSHRVGREW